MSDDSLAYSAFISYAAADREKAQEICSSLESRGLLCWIAPRNVRSGHEYADEIIRGIEQARCLVLVLSNAANQSAFVSREVERAVSKKKPIFPIRIEEVLPSPSLELFVSSMHWIDAWTGQLLDHVDRLAQDMLDGSVLERAATTSKKIARQKQLPRWIMTGLGLLALILAIVIGNALSARLGDRKGAATDEETWFDRYCTQSGVNLQSINKEDFKVTVERRQTTNPRTFVLRVETADPIKRVLNYVQKYYAVDNDGFQQFWLWDGMQTDSRGALVHAKTIRLQFEPEPGMSRHAATIGPFTYPIEWHDDSGAKGLPIMSRLTPAPAGFRPVAPAIDVDEKPSGQMNDQALQKQKDDLLRSIEPLLTQQGHGGVNQLMLADKVRSTQCVKRVYFGEQRDHLDRVIELPEAEQRVASARSPAEVAGQSFPRFLVRGGTGVIFFQLELFDKTRSDIRESRPPQPDYSLRSINIRVPAAANSSNEPALFAAVTPSRVEPQARFTPEFPAGASGLLYSLNDGEFVSTQGSSFAGPLKTKSIRLAFKLKSGQEVGPFQYDLKDCSTLLAEVLKARFSLDLRRRITCKRLTFTYPLEPTPRGTPFPKAMEHTKAMNRMASLISLARLPAFERAPTIVCYPARLSGRSVVGDISDISWAVVREVHLGTRADKLTEVFVTTVDFEEAIHGAMSKMNRVDNALDIWPRTASFPADTESIYARVLFRDGTQSEIIQLAIEDFGVSDLDSSLPRTKRD